MTALAAAAGAVAGAIVGSFLATLCVRWPAGKQVLTGRSRCDNCSRVLGPLELVPIVSAIVSNGRCRACGAPIARLHLWIEVAGAALAGTALALQPNVHGLALGIFWLLLLAPAVLDARHYWLPDTLSLLIAAGGVLLGGLATEASLVDRLIGGAAAALSLGLVAFVYRRVRGREGLGLGDPKLFGAIGLWTGWIALAPILVIAAVSGLVIAAVQGRGRLGRMPFGTLLAAAAILWSGWEAAGRPLPG